MLRIEYGYDGWLRFRPRSVRSHLVREVLSCSTTTEGEGGTSQAIEKTNQKHWGWGTDEIQQQEYESNQTGYEDQSTKVTNGFLTYWVPNT
jgi:hypothetical protein